jgi:hypothetical protein
VSPQATVQKRESESNLHCQRNVKRVESEAYF